MIPAGREQAAAARSSMNGLMLAFAFTLPYHVMRTAAAAGIRIHVLGAGSARGLKTSRCCRAYHETHYAGDPDALLAEIDALVRRYAIDIVFPADDVATRLLSALRDELPVRSMALPDLATFDLLNDKWNFTRFCLANGIRAPQGWLFDSVGDLRAALECDKAALPITVKPTNRSGGVGVFHILERGDLGLIDRLDYVPILVQRHIRGETIGFSMLCDRGKIVAHVVQARDVVPFRIFAEPDLLANVARLVAQTCYTGPANLDAVLCDDDGLSYVVECNPRLWYSINLSMIAGINFIDLALRGGASGTVTTLDRGEIRLSPWQVLRRPWQASRLDWRFLFYNLGDPIAYLLQRGKYYDDSEVAVPAAPPPAGGLAAWPDTASAARVS